MPPRPDPAAAVPGMFSPPLSQERSFPVAAWAAAGLLLVGIVLGLVLATHHRPPTALNSALPLDPYAADLPITGLVMSESTSLSGGKSTFVDGHIRNAGQSTVSGATVQVFFRNDENMPPAIETLPLSLIRTREPYVDTQPISAAPIHPGEDREFRLIFETLPGNWNMQLPEIHIVRIATQP